MSFLSILNPANEQQLTSIELFDLDETDRAIKRAAHVASTWRAVSPADRARLLRRFSDVVGDHIEELARLEVANSGHTIGNARWEAGNVRDVLAYYSGAPE
jgi:acyl-CoA reductase-like NAD-dependent aldehyde dehydrogenase